MAPPRGYPRFDDGDVQIRLYTDDEPLVLHSTVLAIHLDWFKSSLSPKWGRRDCTTAESGKIRWRYELRFDQSADTTTGLLSQAAEPSRNLYMLAKTETTEGNEHQLLPKSSSSDIAKAHEALLSILYHNHPGFGNDSLDYRCTSIRALDAVARAYGGQEIGRLHIQSCLLNWQNEVLSACSSDPIKMLDLALTTRSDWLFKEASVYIIGAPEATFQGRALALGELNVLSLFKKKRAMFVAELQKVDRKLLSLGCDVGLNWQEMLAYMTCRHLLASILQSKGGALLGDDYAVVYHVVLSSVHHDLMIEIDQSSEEMYYVFSEAGVSQEDILLFRGYVHHAFDEMRPSVMDILRDRRFGHDRQIVRSGNLMFMTVEDDELPWLESREQHEAWAGKTKRLEDHGLA